MRRRRRGQARTDRLARVTALRPPPSRRARADDPRRRARQARPSWLLALAAALVLALAPTLSRALAAPASAAPWAGICTPQGLQAVPDDGTPDPAHPVDACVLCTLGAAATPPPAAAIALQGLAVGPGVVVRPADAPVHRPGWRAAAPRAPPPLR